MVVVPRPAKRSRRSNLLFVIFAVAAVVLAGTIVVVYEMRSTPQIQTASQGTPDTAVQAFLSAVFLADDATRLAPVVCSSWPPADALTRTRSMVDAQANVSWDDLHVVTNESGRVTMTARLGLRMPDDVGPSIFQEWQFTVVDQHGWRVCDASSTVS
jgi:hypothetical protein